LVQYRLNRILGQAKDIDIITPLNSYVVYFYNHYEYGRLAVYVVNVRLSFDFQCSVIGLHECWFLLCALLVSRRRLPVRIEYNFLATYCYPTIAKFFNIDLAITMRTDDFGRRQLSTL
jgi:hypothetical protein